MSTTDAYVANANANANANAKQSWGSWFDDTSTNVANSIRDRNFCRPGFVNPALNNPLYHNSAQSKLPRPARAAA